MYAPFTLDQLTVFVAVVDEGSFSAAGRRLGRVQSAVSYAVQQLESALGSQLFDRSRRTPTLTDEGRRLAAEARLVLAQTRELEEVAARLQSGIEPELRVAVDAIYPTSRLVQVCERFTEWFPSTSLRIDVGLLGDAAGLVLAGKADLGACNLAGNEYPGLAQSYLGTVGLVPVCKATHPLAKVDGRPHASVLQQHVQIVHSERSASETRDQGVIASRTWRVTDLQLKTALIRRGVGWGSLPLPIALPMLATGELVRLRPDPWPPDGHRLPLHAVVREDQTLGRAGQWFRERLQLDLPLPTEEGL
ncbi:MAG: LysR family transcriptional regulator [Deltaproteobacteria bacterium]|nr:MAG: LysR family transcriptional regulator [Deltaproteobacteria bacterium]